MHLIEHFCREERGIFEDLKASNSMVTMWVPRKPCSRSGKVQWRVWRQCFGASGLGEGSGQWRYLILWYGIRWYQIWLLLVDHRDNIRPPIASAFSETMVHGHLSEQLPSLIPMSSARQEQLKALNRYRSEKYMDSFLQLFLTVAQVLHHLQTKQNQIWSHQAHLH